MAVETKKPQKSVVEASQVYLLMTEEYRISRNIRASWYFNHLNTDIEISTKDESSEFKELEVLAIEGSALQNKLSEETQEERIYKLTTNSIVHFIARQYRLVFALDLSPSLASVNLHSGEVIYDEVFTALSNTLRGLVRPFYVPGCRVAIAPQVHITVIAHTPVVSCRAQQVLAQGVMVTAKNVEIFLKEIQQELDKFENITAESFAKLVEHELSEEEAPEHVIFELFDNDGEDEPHEDPPEETPNLLVSPETSFVNLLRYGILALQLLPENTSAGMIVITEGMVGLPDTSLFESLLVQLRNSTIACSFIQVGSKNCAGSGWGHMAYVELMQFIATATFGAFFANAPVVPLEAEGEEGLNIYHKAFFLWSFQKGLEGFNVDVSSQLSKVKKPAEELVWSERILTPSGSSIWEPIIMRKKQLEKTLQSPLASIISLRLREGYTIKHVTIKGESQIEVCLMLPWRDHVKIEYTASSVWPLSRTNRVAQVTVNVEGSYEFLHDVTCSVTKPFKSRYRSAMVKRYRHTIQGLTQTDCLLVHLESFATNPVFYQIPERLLNGVPLFYQPPNTTNPVLSMQHSSKDSVLSQFASFWKPVVMLDINIWQKWMHTHRIGIILEHDAPLGRHLHIPNSTGRYSNALCRQALTSLNVLLRDWCTFVLMENHSYIKLLFSEQDKPPTSFYLLRVTSKPPCMVLRLAFLGGTPGSERHQIVQQLKEKVLGLGFPQRGTQTEEKPKGKLGGKQGNQGVQVEVHTPPLQRHWADINCCVSSSKPVEKILMRYERLPDNFMSLQPVHREQSHHVLFQSQQSQKMASSMYNILSRYLFHQRWVWSVQYGSATSISMQAIGRVLATLTKLRLQEGFNIAHTNSGIINLVVEVQMKVPICGKETPEENQLQQQDSSNTVDLRPCTVQYILFPPHTNTSNKEGMSEDGLEGEETTEADGELQLITECWVEPQYGTVVNSTPERSHFDGLSYRDIPTAIYPKDLECISSMVTFEHLYLMCQNISVPSPTGLRNGGSSPSHLSHDSLGRNMPTEPSISQVPFAFDLIGILPKCQQVEVLLSTLIPVADQKDEISQLPPPNNILFALMVEALSEIHDREIHLSEPEHQQFLQLLGNRQRDLDEYPLPFPMPSAVDVVPEVDTRRQLSSDSLQSQSTMITMLSQSQSSKSFERQDTPQGNYGAGVNPGISEAQEKETSVSWRCFVKSISPQQVILMFIPASYDDLLCLMESKEQSNEDVIVLGKDQTSQRTGSDSSTRETSISKDNLTNEHIENVTSDEAGLRDIEAVLSQGESIIKNEHEKPVIEKLDLEKKAECKASVTLPVYFYNCSLNNITEHLVNRWSYEPPDDIFQDLRFENETLNNMTDNRSSEEQQSSTSSKSETPRTEELPNKKPETPRRLYQRQESFRSHVRKASELDSSDYDLSGTFKARSFARDRTTSEQVFGDNIELQQHCMMVSESYYKSFVTGVFKSLQLGQKVDIHDVESAINGICEEKLPVELDISPFLQTVCSHLQGVIEKINMEERCQDDIDMIIIRLRSYNSTIRSKLENKSDVSMLPVTDNELSQKKAGFSDLMSPEPTPRLKKSIPLPLALLQNPETCERVKGLHNLIRIKFEAIMENWFKPVPTNPDFFFFHRNDYDDEEMWQLNQEEEQNENTLSKAPEAQENTAAEDSDTVFTSDFECATPSEHGTNFDSVKPNEYDAETISNALKDDLESLISMNEDLPPLFLHLMCSVKTKGDVYSVSVRHLPTCLGELRECLVDRMEGSDLDLNDLQVTLDMIFLTLPEDTEMHLDSAREEYNREVSYEGAYTDNVKVEQEETKSTMASTDVGFQPQSNDPLSNLPGPQNEAIKQCRDRINWLLRDEIASAMRQVIPLTENTLAMVAKHVQDSKGRPACIHESVPLQFVYGPEQSLTNFVEQFERMDLPGFHLNKEGEYYYLVLDRLRRETTTEPIITAEALSTALNQLNGGDTQKTPEDVSKSGSFVLLKDDSGRARHERSPMSSGERSSKCVSEDITISLTRPSPVKEIPPFPLEELSNRSLEDIGTKSSGSSIQVLEEEAPCIPSSTTTNVNAPVQPPKQQSIIEDKIPDNQTEGNSQSETVNEDGIIKIDTEITETEEKPKEPHVDDFETIKDIESGQDALEMKMDHYSEDQKDNVEIKENVPKEEDGGSAEAAHMKSEKTAPVIPEEAKTKVENDEHIDGEKKDKDIDEVQQETPKEVPSPISPVLKSNEEIERSKLSKQKSLSGESAKGVSSGAGTPRAVPPIGHSPRLSAVMAPTALVCEDIVLEPKTGGKSATFTIGPALGESSPLSDTISPRVAVSDKGQLLRRGSDHELLRRRHSSGDNKHSRSRHASGDNKLNRLKSNQKTSNQDVTPTRNVSGGEIQLRHTSGSGGRTPRHSSGPFSSSRHTSGPETPIRSLSYADFSSQGSYTEGYEGDSSDSDDGVISMNESLIVQRPLLPNFWLIMQNRKDKVDIYFHTRDTGETESERIIQQKMLYNQVIRNIKETCHVVNQILLLQNLNETHMCNALLVPEADEDIIWKQDDLGPPLDRVKKSTDSSDDEDQSNQNYLAATLHFMPGHFGCECVWKMHFNLNPRLRGGPGRSSMARGIQALRSILNPFSVNNRKNMFVYREPQSGNVFYLRLNESRSEVRTSIPNITEATKSEEELPNSISRSSSIWSLQTKPGDMAEDGASVSQLDMTTTPRKPSMNAEREEKTTRKIEECIILSAHGICPVGHEIRDELVKVLSNRLDDHVLGDLTVMLVRNPMCKLTTDDVQFIQKPFQAPRRVIRLSIPSSASLHLYALGYYLRQNLLTFLNTPKYMENKPENFFKDYSGPDPVPLKDSHIFLYNRPQQSGGKGIALIHFSLVDWRGNPVQLISSPKPSPLAYKDIIDATVFESMIATTIYERDPKSKRPGPTSLVQFSIWETGDVGLPQLTDRIMSSLKHAACDIIQEYRLLTVPICEVPQHYAKDLDSPFHSAPPSPSANMIGGSETLMSAKTPNLAVMSARPTSHQGFFDDDVTDILNRSRTNLRQEVLEEQDESIASRDSQRSNELRLKAQMYETGEKGALHQYFFTILPEWLNFCKKLGSPCVETSTQCSLISRYSVELVLREMQHIITNLCADSAPRVFRMIDSGGQEGEPLYMPYNPMRMPLNSDLLESSFDRFTNLQAPGKILNYVLVGRNVSQWRNSIDYVEADDEVSIGFSRSIKSIQKFKPLVDWSLEASTSSLGSYSAGPAPFSGGSLAGGKAFVPRQRLVLLTVKDTQLELYSYNWATDMAKTLASKFYRLVQWHKARSYLLNSIVSQKMGLFHHQKLQNALKDSSFKECPGEVDMLVKYTSPEAKDKEKARSRQVSGSGGMFGYGHPGLHSYDQVLMNSKPTKPMHKMPYGNYRDLVHRHGNQLLEVKHVDQKELDKQMKLENLYVMWQQRAGHAGLPITEDMLELLKQSSRLVHYVATPLLFSPHWRKEVMGLRKPQGVVPQQAAPIHPEVPTPAPAPTKSRSRHSSGASIKSLRSDSLQSLNKIKPHLSDVRNRHIPEEIWHGEIKGTFMQQYITYVQSLGFLQIRTRAASPKRLSRHMRPVSGADQNRRKHPSDDDKAKSNSIYLQKTLPGGIMLMEVGYSEVYFCVRLYAFESSRIPCGRSVNPQLAILFTDECDRMKDLVHVHSFAYDFHLRYIQTYIAGGQGAMKTGYHLRNFLQDFVQLYPYPPSFSRNYINEATITIENTNNPSHHLYNYMLNHSDKLFNMKAIKMVPVSDSDADGESDFALVCQSVTESDGEESDVTKPKLVDHNVGLVISHNAPGFIQQTEAERNTLKLQYFIILTSRREHFPKLTLEKKLGIFKNPLKTFYAGPTNDESMFTPEDLHGPPVTQHIGVRQESVNYLGFSNMHQTPIYTVLIQETEKASKKIREMVDSAISQCRRDTLWQRMLLGDQLVDDGRRKKRSETDESQDSGLTKLTFIEFQELMQVVERESLRQMDPRLTPLHNMSQSWYKGLVRVLMNKYSETHRYFASPDGKVQCVAILNPNYLDTFAMLTVDSINNKSELCVVYKEPILDSRLPANSGKQIYMQSHLEGFVNACCFHMWTGLL